MVGKSHNTMGAIVTLWGIVQAHKYANLSRRSSKHEDHSRSGVF